MSVAPVGRGFLFIDFVRALTMGVECRGDGD